MITKLYDLNPIMLVRQITYSYFMTLIAVCGYLSYQILSTKTYGWYNFEGDPIFYCGLLSFVGAFMLLPLCFMMPFSTYFSTFKLSKVIMSCVRLLTYVGLWALGLNLILMDYSLYLDMGGIISSGYSSLIQTLISFGRYVLIAYMLACVVIPILNRAFATKEKPEVI